MFILGRGNLSVRSLADVVKKDDFVRDSEYLETLLVAVPKLVSSTSLSSRLDKTSQEPNQRMEQLLRTTCIHGRTAVFSVSSFSVVNYLFGICSVMIGTRLIASDDEYTLFSVVIFRRVHDEWVQKCREYKFIVRDFVYSEEEVVRQRQELESADITEKELWVSW